MRKLKLLLLIVLAVVFAASTVVAAETFKAKLTPKEETKKPKSKASGKVEFKLDKDAKTLAYKVEVKHLTDATAAHIHKGKKGEDGPPVAGIMGTGTKKGKFSGVLTEGTLTDKDLMGELQGKTINDLVTLIKSGDAYVNVHTDANPAGEIRGQLK